jgi:rare lipoprotein A
MNQDAAPSMKVDPDSIRDAIPRAEPITSAGNKSPYTVLGKTYHVMASSHGYSEVGTASWYGAKFHGHKTSNGETYSMYDMSAAHKTLPLPSYVKVTNLDNGRTAIVRVNDRGPFKDGRVIDLSYAAATKLGYMDKGTARVRVEAIDTAKGAPPVSLAASKGGMSQADSTARYLQVGAFRDEYSANRLRDEIDQILQYAVFVQPAAGQSLYRVRIGPFFTDAELLTVQQMLAAAQYGRALIVTD